jgi:hypothetical protein
MHRGIASLGTNLSVFRDEPDVLIRAALYGHGLLFRKKAEIELRQPYREPNRGKFQATHDKLRTTVLPQPLPQRQSRSPAKP